MGISVYKVMVSGGPIVVKTEDGLSKFGFVRNEYVLAGNEQAAILKAKEKIYARLNKKVGLSISSELPLEIVIDEVQSGISFWKLFVNESFIFYDM